MSVPLPALVWVDVTGSWTEPHPGILLDWRRVERDMRPVWEGWVISAWAGGAPAHGERVYVHQAWTDAAHIRIAEAPRPTAATARRRADRPR